MSTKTQNDIGIPSRQQAVAFAYWLETAVNAHDVAALVDRYAEDAVLVSPVFREITGRAAIAKSWETIFHNFPDWQVKTVEVLVDGSRLAFVGSCTATDRNGWFGLPATGERLSYRAVILLTLRDGKVVRDQRMYDLTGVLEHLEKARLDAELKTAAQVQNALLSRSVKTNDHCEAAGDSVACRTIGGDFFELFESSSGDFGMLLGDVAGKGPAAALLASMLQGMFAVESRIASRPSQAVTNVNATVAAKELGARFATLAYARLSRSGELVCCNAGHNPPVVAGRSGIQRCHAGGAILGAFRGSTYSEQRIQLHAGDAVIMFTDGVTETRNPAGEEFGEERLIALVTSLRDCAAQQMARAILAGVADFSEGAAPEDDVTVAVAKYLP